MSLTANCKILFDLEIYEFILFELIDWPSLHLLSRNIRGALQILHYIALPHASCLCVLFNDYVINTLI